MLKKDKKIYKILLIISFYKNLDLIFYRSTINILKSISPNYKIYKSYIGYSSTIYILIYFNILSTNVLDTHLENKLIKLNEEVSVYRINRHKFLELKLKILKNDLKFQLQKELFYTQSKKQKILLSKISKCLEKLDNVKYL
uniref:Uncharacterized protein n=1 Tax=Protohalopteris sp. TaxID=2843287 RepID=A0A8F0F7G8_9PHAE|nr:hypothetical protein [Protohalopteris sp.]